MRERRVVAALRALGCAGCRGVAGRSAEIFVVSQGFATGGGVARLSCDAQRRE